MTTFNSRSRKKAMKLLTESVSILSHISIFLSKQRQNIWVSRTRPQEQDSNSANYGLLVLFTYSSKDLICSKLLCNNLLIHKVNTSNGTRCIISGYCPVIVDLLTFHCMVTHKTAIKLSHGTDNQYIVFKKKTRVSL